MKPELGVWYYIDTHFGHLIVGRCVKVLRDGAIMRFRINSVFRHDFKVKAHNLKAVAYDPRLLAPLYHLVMWIRKKCGKRRLRRQRG